MHWGRLPCFNAKTGADARVTCYPRQLLQGVYPGPNSLLVGGEEDLVLLCRQGAGAAGQMELVAEIDVADVCLLGRLRQSGVQLLVLCCELLAGDLMCTLPRR